MEDSNLSHYITIGVVATFRWLRYTIGIIGVLGLLVSIYLCLQVLYPPAKVAVNPNPVCNREAYLTAGAVMFGVPQPGTIPSIPPTAWGDYVKSIGSDHPTFYVREANGTGWCRVIRDNAPPQIRQMPTADHRTMAMYVYRWYEVPSQYGDRVELLAPPPANTKFLWALGIGFVSVGLIFGIWLPATIVAAVGRRWLLNIKSNEPL